METHKSEKFVLSTANETSTFSHMSEEELKNLFPINKPETPEEVEAAFDKYLDEFSELMTNAYQEMAAEPPNEFETEEGAKLRRKAQIKASLKEYQKTILNGVSLFLSQDREGKVGKMLEKFKEMPTSPEKIPEMMQSFSEEDYNSLFALALEVYEKKDLESAYPMMSTLVALFPTRLQPYLALASIEKEKNGVYAALRIYEALVQVMENPVLYYYAADAYLETGDKSKAADWARKALKLCEGDETMADLMGELRRLLLRAH